MNNINDWNDVRGKKVFKKEEETKDLNFSLINKRITIIVENELLKFNKLYINNDGDNKQNFGKWTVK